MWDFFLTHTPPIDSTPTELSSWAHYGLKVRTDRPTWHTHTHTTLISHLPYISPMFLFPIASIHILPLFRVWEMTSQLHMAILHKQHCMGNRRAWERHKTIAILFHTWMCNVQPDHAGPFPRILSGYPHLSAPLWERLILTFSCMCDNSK